MSDPVEHRIRTGDGVEIALIRVAPDGPGDRMAVLLSPGTFSNRAFWLGTRGHGFGLALAAAGFDPWIIEHRGHGASDRPATWTIDEWVRLDAVAAVEEVVARTGRETVAWVGHSAGAVVGAALAGSGLPAGERLSAMVLVGGVGPGGLAGVRRLGARAVLLWAMARPGFLVPGRWIGLGPEREPGRLIRDWMRWNLNARWRAADGSDYLAGLGTATLPVLAIGGAGDRWLAPPVAVRDLLERFGSADRTLTIAGRTTGFTMDYDHNGLMVSRDARTEIWPMIIDWLRARSG